MAPRRVTYSRNFTISLSRTCRCFCKYCSFATRQAHLYSPDEVEELLDEALRRRAKELLVLTGEAPDVNPVVRARLAGYGHEDFTAYVVWVCERALERGLLPHTNIGVVPAADLDRLRRVTASQGLMLESVAVELMETVHAGSPTKHPRVRLDFIREAGRRRIPFTSGILVGIGETRAQRFESLDALAAVQAEFGHLQEVIIQNYVDHPRYYGVDVAALADTAAQHRQPPPSHPQPPGGQLVVNTTTNCPPDGCGDGGVGVEEIAELVEHAREVMPGIGVQVPPNLSEHWPQLVLAGATDLGGLSANGDHISPELAFPGPAEVRDRLAPLGVALAERLCVYPEYINDRWLDPSMLDVISEHHPTFVPHAIRAAGGENKSLSQVAETVAKACEGDRLTIDEMEMLFAEVRPEAVETIRAGADGLRNDLHGEVVTFVVNRNINFTNVCTVGCAFCGFGKARRSADAYHLSEPGFRERVEEAVEAGATEICLQGGIHPDYRLVDYGRWLELAREVAPEIHLHAYSPMEIDYMCETSGLAPAQVFEYLIGCGLGSTPGTAAEILDDDVRSEISPNKLPAARWVEIVEASHRAGLRSTATVMFGHIETPRQLARHMDVVRGLQQRTGGITEFVPLGFIPFQTRLGRTRGIEELPLRDNLRQTAVMRLALGRSIANLQASWVKMGLDAAAESLRWGVNDLGGTLMEENISRMAGADHGVRLEPDELVAAARRAGRMPVQRTTLYEVVETYEQPAPVGSPDEHWYTRT